VEINETLEEIDWKVFPKHGLFKGLRKRYERMTYAQKVEWQRWMREGHHFRGSNNYIIRSDIPMFDQWYMQASIAEVELWEWEIMRKGIIDRWLSKITVLLFGRTQVAGLIYWPIMEALQAAQIKRDEARVAVMRKKQLKQLVGRGD
jgi:hypothetical protein